jgi:hypothetical protein
VIWPKAKSPQKTQPITILLLLHEILVAKEMSSQSHHYAMAISSGSTILPPSVIMLQYYIDESEVSGGLGASFNPLTAKSHHGSAKQCEE